MTITKLVCEVSDANDLGTRQLISDLNNYFEKIVEIPRMKVGKRQTFEMLISEEALLFSMYLRNEKKEWMPRMVSI